LKFPQPIPPPVVRRGKQQGQHDLRTVLPLLRRSGGRFFFFAAPASRSPAQPVPRSDFEPPYARRFEEIYITTTFVPTATRS
jgi:hypothetical protein